MGDQDSSEEEFPSHGRRKVGWQNVLTDDVSEEESVDMEEDEGMEEDDWESGASGTDEGDSEEEEDSGEDEEDSGEGEEGSETDGEEEDEEEDGEEQAEEEEKGEADAPSEEEENCAICLNEFELQEVGTPASCQHNFCIDCLLEWSKNINSCPVDRQQFNTILVRQQLGGKVIKKLKVSDVNQFADVEEEEDNTYCQVCHLATHEDRMLLCDICDAGYHMECLTPPLDAVPIEEWFCPQCAPPENSHEEEEAVEERLLPELPVRRAIARTRASERVRARVSRVRAARSRVRTAQPSGSRSVSRRGRGRSTSTRGRSTSRSTSRGRGRGRRTGTTRRKTTRKRSSATTRKRKTKKTTTAAGTTVRRRRKRRRRKKRKVKRVPVKKEIPTTVKSRLAERLQLGKPIQGSSVPSVKKTSEGKGKADFVRQPLMVFGDPNGLHCFEDSEDSLPGAPAVPVTSRSGRVQVLSKSALRSHRPVGRAVPIGIASELAASPTQASSDATLDILGSIFAEQELLHLPGSAVTINRDGSLTYGHTDSGANNSIRGTVRVVPRGEGRPNRMTNGVPSNQTALGSPPASGSAPQNSAGTSSSSHNNQGSQQGGGAFSMSSATSGSSVSNQDASQGGQHSWGPLGNQGAASLTTGCHGNEPNRKPNDEEEEEGPSRRKSESTDSFKPRQELQDESNSSTEDGGRNGSRLFSQRQWKPIQINIKSSLPQTDTSPVQDSVRTELPSREEPQEGAAGFEGKQNTSSSSSAAEQEYNPFSPTASPVRGEGGSPMHGEEGSASVEYNPFSPTPEDDDNDDQSNPSPESETNNNVATGTAEEPWEVEDSNDMVVDMGTMEDMGADSPGVDSLHIDLDTLSPEVDRDEEEEPAVAEESKEEEEMTGEESIEDFQFEEELDEFPLQKSPETFAMCATPPPEETPTVESAEQTESKRPASKTSKAVLDMFSGLSPDKGGVELSGVADENQEGKATGTDAKGGTLYEDELVLESEANVNTVLQPGDVETTEKEGDKKQSASLERRHDDKEVAAPGEAVKSVEIIVIPDDDEDDVPHFASRMKNAERPTSQEGWDSSEEDTLDIRPLPNIMDLPKIPKMRPTSSTSREKDRTKDKPSSSKGKKRRRDSPAEGHQKDRTKEKRRDREKRKEASESKPSRKRKSDDHDSEEDLSQSSRRKRVKAKRSSSRRHSREREKRREDSFRVERSSSMEQEGNERADRSHRSYRRHRQESSSSLSLSSEDEISPERTRRSKSKDRPRMRSQHSSAPSSKSKGKEDRERRKYHKESRREKNDSDKSDWSRGSSRDRKKEEKKRERKHEESDRKSKERTTGKGRGEQRKSKESSPQEYKRPKEKSPEYKREERVTEPPKSDSRTLAEKIAEKNEKLYNYGDHDYRKTKDNEKKEKAEKVKSGTLMEELRKVGKPRLQSTVRKVSNAEQEEDVLPFSSFLSPGGMDRDHRSRVEREGPRTPEYSKQKNGDQSQTGSKDEDSDEGEEATLSRFLVPGGMDKDHRSAEQAQLSNNSSSRDDPRVEKMSRSSGERSSHNLPVLEPLRPPEIKPQLTLPQSLLTVLGVLTAQKPNTGVVSGPAATGSSGQQTVTIEATSPEDVEMRDVEEAGRDDVDENIESSAVEMDIKEKMLEKLNRQERVAEEVKLALKPFYQTKKIDKQQYKEILKKSVLQVCHTRTGKIDPVKIRRLVRQYVEKYRAMEKYLAKKGQTSSQSLPWYQQARK